MTRLKSSGETVCVEEIVLIALDGRIVSAKVNATAIRAVKGEGKDREWSSTIRSVVNGSARMSIHEGCDIETARTS